VVVHAGGNLQRPVDCFLKVPAWSRRLSQFSLEKILRLGGRATLGEEGVCITRPLKVTL
jgi:hypothetical protein